MKNGSPPRMPPGLKSEVFGQKSDSGEKWGVASDLRPQAVPPDPQPERNTPARACLRVTVWRRRDKQACSACV